LNFLKIIFLFYFIFIYYSSFLNFLIVALKIVMAESPHTIGVEFGTRIFDVMDKKIKLQIVRVFF